MKAVRNTLTTGALLGMLVGTAFQAQAENLTEVTAPAMAVKTQVIVNVADLNLSSPEGQKALYARISNAAEKACGPRDWRRAGSGYMASRNRECYDQSLSRALSEANQAWVASAN
ncbi:MAG: UrcA family protein [Congregibacter sp.]